MSLKIVKTIVKSDFDLTIDRWLVLFNKKCFHDLEMERVIVCIYDFCIVNQDFSCEFGTMSCVQVQFGSA